MSRRGHRNGWVIVVTFLFAFMLMYFPLPSWLQVIRPEWVTLVLIYWCLALPERVGVGIGWGVGLMLDVARGAVFGQYALALGLIAFLVVNLYKRIRLFPIWQQAVSVMLLILLSQLLTTWIKGIVGHPTGGWMSWLPAVSSLLIWPLLFIVLRNVRRYYRVS